MSQPIVAVIGASDATADDIKIALEAGRLIAEKGWLLVTGGLGGVMEAASQGASLAGGTVIGILPQGSTKHANSFVTVPIATNMGHARNAIIAHTADALIAVGGGFGTLSEIALARKLGKPVFSVKSWNVADVIPKDNAASAIEELKNLFLSSP